MKGMKKALSLILTAALLGVLVLSLTACGSKKEPETTAAATEAATEAAKEEATEAPTEAAAEAAKEEATEAPAEEAADAAKEDAEEAPAAEEKASGDVLTVAFEDFDGQESLSKSIQNGNETGKAVEIEGISRKIGSKYSIGQVKDGKFIGTNYAFDGEYPAEDAHVKLTGTVVQDGVVFSISADSIEVVE